ncbi:hypothetical protein CEXT_489601 [Caerostris extrusa]|uniref:Cadherin domain-containing protein n=1 Tax=Caerostris extrusa TaxID=172846 RepID=A0AAV4TER2_CAEEX|nr:hypothetical protein CEXT_489601 [Caerostris extrusa]
MESSTMVVVKINDVNDLPPKFDQPSYITTILEEDQEGMPKTVLKVVLLSSLVVIGENYGGGGGGNIYPADFINMLD